jgi:hypothetical protein
MNRLAFLKEHIGDFQNVSEMMREVFNILNETDRFPIAGRNYTFSYRPKTRNIVYDPYPIVAVFAVEDWGIKGINYHWKKQKNYSWKEIKSPLYIVKQSEVAELEALQSFFKPKINV